MIEYNDSKHQYSYNGVPYISVTQLISQYHEEFDTQARAKSYAEKHGETPEFWVKKWTDIRDESLRRGNAIHKEQEDLLEGGATVVDGVPFFTQNADLHYRESYLADLPDGVYPEIKLWSHFYRVAGRSDRILITTDQRTRYVRVQDHKTNKELKKLSYQFRGGAYKMMFPPLGHIMDSNYWHYALQLSTYMYMAETMGFVPDPVLPLQVIHYPHSSKYLDVLPPGVEEDLSPIFYDLPYLRKEVVSMMTHHKKTHGKSTRPK